MRLAESIVNWNVISEVNRLENGEKLFASIFALFRETLGEELQELGDAIARSDFAAVRRIAHRLKSSTSYLGAEAIRDLCNELESAADAASTEKLLSVYNDLRESTAQTVEVISNRFPVLREGRC